MQPPSWNPLAISRSARSLLQVEEEEEEEEKEEEKEEEEEALTTLDSASPPIDEASVVSDAAESAAAEDEAPVASGRVKAAAPNASAVSEEHASHPPPSRFNFFIFGFALIVLIFFAQHVQNTGSSLKQGTDHADRSQTNYDNHFLPIGIGSIEEDVAKLSIADSGEDERSGEATALDSTATDHATCGAARSSSGSISGGGCTTEGRARSGVSNVCR